MSARLFVLIRRRADKNCLAWGVGLALCDSETLAIQHWNLVARAYDLQESDFAQHLNRFSRLTNVDAQYLRNGFLRVLGLAASKPFD
jgi:hypothetical protein